MAVQTEATSHTTNCTHTNIDPLSYLSTNNVNSMFLHPTDREETDKVCKLLAKKKSKGPDSLPTFMAITKQ